MSDVERRQALADFLRTRRERLVPLEFGLPRGRRRRTPGLRREEVAQMANIGVSWYTSLEQGRDIHPSTEILNSIASALRLTSAERQHLFLLAGQQHLVVSPLVERISPALQRVLDDLNPDPAYVMGWRWDYVAWNKAAELLLAPETPSPPYEYNIVWRIFTSPQRLTTDPRWQEIAQRILAEFRAEIAPYLEDAWFKQLIADLQRESPEFREWWPRYDVSSRVDRFKEMEHPLVGSLQFEHTTLQVSTNPNLKVMIYTPVPGTDTASRMHKLLEMELSSELV